MAHPSAICPLLVLAAMNRWFLNSRGADVEQAFLHCPLEESTTGDDLPTASSWTKGKRWD
eukprot:2961194-Rhodomonas_salina.1